MEVATMAKSKTKAIKNVKPLIGCPPMYKTPEEMQAAIDKYFADCDQVTPALDVNGNPMLYKGQPVLLKEPTPYTVTGLALALGFKSRQALINYQVKDAFNDAITRAKLKIEDYAAQRLYDKEGSNGAKFTLGCNYQWKDTQSIELTGKVSVEAYLKDCEDSDEF